GHKGVLAMVPGSRPAVVVAVRGIPGMDGAEKPFQRALGRYFFRYPVSVLAAYRAECIGKDGRKERGCVRARRNGAYQPRQRHTGAAGLYRGTVAGGNALRHFPVSATVQYALEF